MKRTQRHCMLTVVAGLLVLALLALLPGDGAQGGCNALAACLARRMTDSGR